MMLSVEEIRNNWLRDTLGQLPAGESILDVGAGEQQYKKHCLHLKYIAQDVAEYNGEGDSSGLQTGVWDTSHLDLVCDLYDIDESTTYDNLMCTEVLEHVVDPVLALEKFSKLVKPGGKLIITAPFNSLTHFAPYHFATGFNQFFYKHHFERLGFELSQIRASGNYISYVNSEIKRLNYIISHYNIVEPNRIFRKILTRLLTRYLNKVEKTSAANNTSSLGCYGYFVIAIKKD